MKFEEAYSASRKGHKIKLPEWKDCWIYKNDHLEMHCKDGTVIDVREMTNTLQFMLREDWITDREHPEEFKDQLTFEEALECLKSGKTLCRLRWNDNLRVTANMIIPMIMYHKNIENRGWMLCGAYHITNEDIFAEDWYIVK